MKVKKLIPAGAALAVPVMLCGAADYLFRCTFLRADKPDPWAPGREHTVLHDRAFFERADRQLLEITSRDGLRLKAWLYNRGSDVTVILCHGYRGGPEELSGIAARLFDAGMNVLLIYQRAHELSEGRYFTMGSREKLDVADWAREIAARKPAGKIVLFGWSMGGNTVMGAVGEDLPENVVCAVEDCGYDNLRSQLLYSCKNAMPKLPAKRMLIGLLDLYCRTLRGFPLEEPRGEPLARTRLPMLFIHGTNDKVVPYGNLERCYEPCAAPKQSATYIDASHVSSCCAEKERYFRELIGFIRKFSK